MSAEPREFFVDTGAWFAFVYRDDPAHERVREAMAPLEGRLTTSNYVLDETLTLLRFRAGHPSAIRVGKIIRNPKACRLERVALEDEEAAWDVFVRRADQKYSFTDCTTFSLMRRLGIREAIALDDDFAQEGFGVRP